MRLDHLAIWCSHIEAMRTFYMKYFGCVSNAKYYNLTKQFSSYFLSFPGETTRIELMERPDIIESSVKRGFTKGIAHFDIEIGSKKEVDMLVERFRNDGITIASPCRTTGDGYYEAAVLDPEGNYIELSAKNGLGRI